MHVFLVPRVPWELPIAVRRVRALLVLTVATTHGVWACLLLDKVEALETLAPHATIGHEAVSTNQGFQ